MLDAIFGGTSSSRLFQEVREQRGLAYSVYSFTGQYADTGQVGLYVGTRAGQPRRGAGGRRRRARALPPGAGVTAEELRARQGERQGPASCSSLESTAARMNRLGSSVLAGLPLLELDELDRARSTP